MSKYIGDVSAYAYAVSKGYTGTEEEFAELMADYAEVGQRAEDAAESALNSKTAAQTAAQTATTKAGEASTSATSASGSATAASASASAASGSATSAANSATAASGSATSAAGSATTASTKASEASASATDAATAKTGAEAAQTAAEAAQGKAEDAQEAAETTAQSISASAAQIATNTADIAQLKVDVSQKANINGYYEELSSGTADQLNSTQYVEDSVPYLFRTTGGSADVGDRADVRAIVGGTVAWNQLVQNGNFSDGKTGWSANNGEVTASDGKLSFSPTATTSGKNFGGSNTQPTFITAGHKYFFSFYAKVSTTEFGGNFTYDIINDGTMRSKALTANVDTHFNGVVTAQASNRLRPFFYPWGAPAVTTDGTEQVVVHDIRVHDLTQMFGSTIADYIYTLEQSTAGAGVAFFRKLFPADYYPYDAGTLKSVEGVSEKVTRDADNNVLGTYPLDSTLTLRGIPKLADGKLSYDGDRYLPDGTVTRKYGIRAYQSGDESLADAITDGTNTVYKLTTPTTETADSYQSLQVCDPNGTEEFVSTGIVPVGHETRYPENLRAKIEGLPWDFSSLIAPTEKTTTASRNYTTGSLLIMNNVLYKVIANIANGGTITPNTNVTATTLSEVISALQ